MGIMENRRFRIEDEIQIIPPLAPVPQPSTFIKTLQGSKPYYNKLRIKRPRSFLITPLKCEKDPFFECFLDISKQAKFSYNDLFTVESDIFKDCSIDWVQMKKMIIEGLFNSALKLEKFTILEVLSQTVSKVLDIVAVAASMGVKVRWIGRILGGLVEFLVRSRQKDNTLICFKRLEIWIRRSSS